MKAIILDARVMIRLRCGQSPSTTPIGLFTGPPGDPSKDEMVAKQFLAEKGKKVISGGTTANIISRITGQRLTVEMRYHDAKIPPIGYIAGIDLVTEGILTLNAAVERLGNEQCCNKKQLDGATLLARMLLDSDIIKIYAGSTDQFCAPKSQSAI